MLSVDSADLGYTFTSRALVPLLPQPPGASVPADAAQVRCVVRATHSLPDCAHAGRAERGVCGVWCVVCGVWCARCEACGVRCVMRSLSQAHVGVGDLCSDISSSETSAAAAAAAAAVPLHK